MSKQALGGNDSAPTEVESKEPMTLQEVRQARIAKIGGQPKESKEEEKPSAEVDEGESEEAEEQEVAEATEDDNEQVDESAEEESEQSEDSEEEDSNDVLSQIDWDALDEDTKVAIATQVGSGAGKRIGELVAKTKDLEAQLAAKDKAIAEGMSGVLKPNNMWSQIQSDDELGEIEKRVDGERKYFQTWLAGDDSYYTDSNGTEYSRKDIASHIENLERQLKAIPDQRKYLSDLSKATAKAKETEEKLNSEFDWIHDTSSATYRAYDELVSNSDFEVIKRIAPTIAAKLKLHYAHAAQSMTGTSKPKKKIVLKTKKGKPVAAPDSGSKSSSPNAREKAQLKELQKRARSGDVKAARELRLAQITRRFKA